MPNFLYKCFHMGVIYKRKMGALQEHERQRRSPPCIPHFSHTTAHCQSIGKAYERISVSLFVSEATVNFFLFSSSPAFLLKLRAAIITLSHAECLWLICFAKCILKKTWVHWQCLIQSRMFDICLLHQNHRCEVGMDGWAWNVTTHEKWKTLAVKCLKVH